MKQLLMRNYGLELLHWLEENVETLTSKLLTAF